MAFFLCFGLERWAKKPVLPDIEYHVMWVQATKKKIYLLTAKYQRIERYFCGQQKIHVVYKLWCLTRDNLELRASHRRHRNNTRTTPSAGIQRGLSTWSPHGTLLLLPLLCWGIDLEDFYAWRSTDDACLGRGYVDISYIGSRSGLSFPLIVTFRGVRKFRKHLKFPSLEHDLHQPKSWCDIQQTWKDEVRDKGTWIEAVALDEKK